MTREQKELAIRLAAEGATITKIADELLISHYDLWQYRQHNPSFANIFDDARQEGLEYLAEGLLTAHEDIADVQKARLKSENTRWYLSKAKPKKYGDRIDLNVTQTIDISNALSEAKERAALPIRDVTPRANNKVVTESISYNDLLSDIESDLTPKNRNAGETEEA